VTPARKKIKKKKKKKKEKKEGELRGLWWWSGFGFRGDWYGPDGGE
jgi:hypothetical protein